MLVTVTAKYSSIDKIRNAEEDLVATGIPSDEIFVDKETKQIKVRIAETAKPEILELLGRHDPTQIG
jgi:hypothetical protein